LLHLECFEISLFFKKSERVHTAQMAPGTSAPFILTGLLCPLAGE